MSIYDDIFRMMQEAERFLKPMRDMERLYGRDFLHVVKELQERERLFRGTLSGLNSTYPSAIGSLQITMEQRLHEINRHILPMNLLADAHKSLSGLLSTQGNLTNISQASLTLSPQWQDTIKIYQPPSAGVNAAEIALMSHYAKMANSAFLAQERLLRVPWESIGNSTQINPTESSRIINGFTTLMETYRPLIQSFEESEHFIALFPPITSAGPPLEIFTSARLLDLLFPSSPEEDYPTGYHQFEVDLEDEIEAGLDELLLALNPDLHSIWFGAKEALRSENPERIRHVLISLRELITHVLDDLAPNDQVRDWTSDPSHFHKGNPTREARVLFICRGVNHGPFCKFISADVKACIKFIALFQRGTHKLGTSFSNDQLRALVIRTESFLRFLLLIHQAIQ